MIHVGEYTIGLVNYSILLLLASIATEAVTEILVASELTEPLHRKWKQWVYPVDKPPSDTFAQKIKIWIDKLASCGYCTSVWVAGFFAVFLPKIEFSNWFINWLCVVFVLHRLSNWIHIIFELVKKGRVKTYDLEIKYSENRNGSVGESTRETESEARSGADDEAGDG